MKKSLTMFFILLISQVFSQQTKFVDILSETRVVNSRAKTARSSHSTTRIAIDVPLPNNTIGWYYKLTVVEKDKQIPIQTSFGAELGKAVKNFVGKVNPVEVLNFVDPPNQERYCDFYISTSSEKYKFLQVGNSNFKVFQKETKTNTASSVGYVSIVRDDIFIGIRNNSLRDAIKVKIEITAEVRTEEADKGSFYGSLGWKEYQKGDYNKCIEYSVKALSYNSNLGWVNANLGLSYLMLGNIDKAYEAYADAIAITKKEKNAKWYFSEFIKDIDNAKQSNSDIQGINDIRELLNRELSKY